MGTNATDATPPTCVDRDRFTRDVPNDLVFTIPHPSHAQHRSSYFIAMRSMLHESFVGWHSASSAVDEGDDSPPESEEAKKSNSVPLRAAPMGV